MKILKYQEFLNETTHTSLDEAMRWVQREFSAKKSQRELLSEMMRLNQESGLYDSVNEGGAYGHLAHPFEDIGLTMQDINDMITAAVEGAFGPENFVQEKCLHESSEVILKKRGKISIKELVENRYEDDILSINELHEIIYQPILDWINNEETDEWLLIKTEDGKELILTSNHRVFLDGFDVKAEQLKVGDELLVI